MTLDVIVIDANFTIYWEDMSSFLKIRLSWATNRVGEEAAVVTGIKSYNTSAAEILLEKSFCNYRKLIFILGSVHGRSKILQYSSPKGGTFS